MKKKVVIVFIIFILFLGNSIVNADMGNKPSILIKIKNLETSNYLIDLFEYKEYSDSYYGINPNKMAEWFKEIANERRNHISTS